MRASVAMHGAVGAERRLECHPRRGACATGAGGAGMGDRNPPCAPRRCPIPQLAAPAARARGTMGVAESALGACQRRRRETRAALLVRARCRAGRPHALARASGEAGGRRRRKLAPDAVPESPALVSLGGADYGRNNTDTCRGREGAIWWGRLRVPHFLRHAHASGETLTRASVLFDIFRPHFRACLGSRFACSMRAPSRR